MASNKEAPPLPETTGENEEPKPEITNKETENAESEKTKEDQILTLMSSDGKEFKITESAAVFSETIKNMIEDDCASSAIPLPVVDGVTLAKVADYLKKKSELGSKPEADRKKFEEEFVVAEDMRGLFELISAANYLNIKDLIKSVAEQIADRMKNKSVKWVRKTFALENDFTPEEEQAIRDEYPWAWEGVDPDTDDE
ncbi:hypothetical protein BUALT_Bualt01G0099900 [Buddleja alternifolia]|uniref:SKP1-like protein n=1 Tax=Buddleja alternifolia TaxID=168488 RepID=A0AAV6YGD4_9LAMI|nr:hypothetical protein BUALT_Bualt01G0099900 [Buddleja alternifolia]